MVGAAQALEPNRAVTEYIRDRWDSQKGFPGGPVYAIAQTSDGYLWLGTEKGLVRFDGFDFRLLDHAISPAFPRGPILDLVTDAEGNLWIRPQSRSILRYRDGAFEDVMPALDSARSGVTAMCRGAKGAALFEVLEAGTFLYSDGSFARLMTAAELSDLLIISMAQTADGKIWMGTRDAGLFYASEGRMFAATKGLPDRKINSLLAVGDRELWIGTDNGVVRWNGNETVTVGTPLDHIQALALTSDRDSNIWIGTSNGLLRVNASGVSSMVGGNDGSTGAVNAILEDREGNLWVGSTRGIERIRDTPFITYSDPQNPSSGNGAVYVDSQGRTWFAPIEGGLYLREGARVSQVKNDGLDHDVIYALTGSKDDLWIGRQRGGLTHLRYDGRSFAGETYTQAEGLAQNSIYAVHQSRDGAVWAGTVSGGITRFKEGKFNTYTEASGLSSNTVTSILEGSDGTMWFGTANGLNSLLQNSWTTYGSTDGLPPGRVNCLVLDSRGAIWVGTENGIAVLDSGEIAVPRRVPDSLHEPILGIAEDRNGWLWISTAYHVLRVSRDRLMVGVINDADVREFGLADGLRSVEGVKRHRPVVMDGLGRIWLSTSRGLSVVDPARVAIYSAPAIVRIEGVTADSSSIDVQSAVHISSARQRITFSYAGLSLTVPERVRFRYRLDRFDRDWSKAVATREAVYTNLAPGSYRFRVMASNSDGLWNGPEAAIQFEIEPVFWETWWFRVSCAMSIALAILLAYRLRLRLLTGQLNMRFDERLAERTRIAQDLHDTLLQGFLSASMQLDVAADRLPPDSPAKPLVSRVLELMRQVIDEGRTALRGLRSPGSDSPDLAESFAGIWQELDVQERVDYQVNVEGSSRPLRPLIRDEVYRIGREALVNAFRHSQARNVEVILEYRAGQLRVLVRDDGCGMDPQVLRSGREGHWGLPGMRERADEIGASLKVWSRTGAGTEVELSIPGDVAFESNSSAPRRWFARLQARKARARAAKTDKRGK